MRHKLFAYFLLALGCGYLAVSPMAEPPAPLPPPAFQTNKLRDMDSAVLKAVADKQLPGGVLWLESGGNAYHRAYGLRAIEPAAETMTEDTLFDAASLTKVVATTPSILLLLERGKLKLDAPARDYLPEFKNPETITVRHLLTHTSGLRPGLSRWPAWTGYDTGIRMACAETSTTKPGAAFRYSDINFILLGEIVRRVSGLPLNEFAQKELYGPLKMKDTGYLPATNRYPRVAPTERISGQCLRGQVHDPTARAMGGVAGHAGVFTTAADLARYARMFLNGGELDGVRVFRPETVRLMTTPQAPAAANTVRGLGWDIDSPYAGPRGKCFPVGSYGHSGWTGTSLWIDPASRTFLIFLSNRNHPTENGSVLALRAQLGTLAAESLTAFHYSPATGVWPPGEPPKAAAPASGK